jgi:hypothetical protein
MRLARATPIRGEAPNSTSIAANTLMPVIETSRKTAERTFTIVVDASATTARITLLVVAKPSIAMARAAFKSVIAQTPPNTNRPNGVHAFRYFRRTPSLNSYPIFA